MNRMLLQKKHQLVSTLLLFFAAAYPAAELCAQNRSTLRIDAQATHQRITGFGAFVCSPQFTYNHMSTTEIKQVWGNGSTLGCNIMRIYIPIGKNAWGQSLQTAKLAKQMGLIVFASPWGQPAEWKTNGTINAKNEDGTTGKLKPENWADYAKYLEDYVQYMRQNGVELDAISIQNEPDWAATYAGCLWSADEIASFVKQYGRSISCKIMAPETLSVNDNYVNALNKADVIDCFDIYGGHQYGGIQSAYKNLAKKGKEIWMTEYLINWNEIENNDRNIDFSKDFFNFYRSINTCMLGDFNAWIHYAAKRYYAMMGDGQRGTNNGVITKRGYIMAHFARFVTGMTRIDGSFSGSGNLEGSYYISQTGDTVVAVLANDSEEIVDLTLDLPFYTEKGKTYTTSKTKNLVMKLLDQTEETCRPTTKIDAKSVTTVLFVRSRDRQASNMTGSIKHFDLVDDLTRSKNTFGTLYKISNKTKTFDQANPLFSTRTNVILGYLEVPNRASKLVMNIKKVTSKMNYTSSETTLYYANAEGKISKHNYGEIDMGRRENFDVTFDLSPATLTDGCIGIVALTNNNYTSVLNITFGDVYVTSNHGYSATLTGAYVDDDSYVLDLSEDATCTSVDLTKVTDMPSELPWMKNTNRVVYVAADSPLTGDNIVKGNTCSNLSLTDNGGDFRPATAFEATKASFTCTVDSMRLVVIPFKAAIPEGVKAYRLKVVAEEIQDSIEAHTPVLIATSLHQVTFEGNGTVAYKDKPEQDVVFGSYKQIPLYAGDFVLDRQDNVWGWKHVRSNATLEAFGVYTSLDATVEFLPLTFPATAIENIEFTGSDNTVQYFDLQGRKLNTLRDVNPNSIILIRRTDGKTEKLLKK